MSPLTRLVSHLTLCLLQPPPPLVRIRKWAVASAVLYAAGIPLVFAWLLFSHRREIQADQQLRVRGQGNSRALNPYFPVRQRYQKLYSVFRPETYYWRLVLMARKFCIAGVAIMFNSVPMFQASLSVGIIFLSYALHVRVQPFLDRLDLEVPADSVEHARKEGAVLNYVFMYNKLESVYLICSLVILLCGMIFESGYLRTHAAAYNLITWIVSASCTAQPCRLLLSVILLLFVFRLLCTGCDPTCGLRGCVPVDDGFRDHEVHPARAPHPLREEALEFASSIHAGGPVCLPD